MATYLLLLLPAALSAGSPPPHASLLYDSPYPNLLNTPELAALSSPSSRRLQPRGADGAWPAARVEQSFTGVTRRGFVDVRLDAQLRGATVLLADYAELLSGASFACAASDGAALGVRIRASPPAVALHAAAAAHLADKLAAGAVLVFDVPLLATHASFAAGTPCATGVDHAKPFFEVLRARPRGGAHHGFDVELALRPAEWTRAFHALNYDVDLNPNVTDALARRRLEGRPLGDPAAVAAFERRQLLSGDAQVAGAFLNANNAPPYAATSDLPLFSAAPTALVCKNCFAVFTMGVRASMSMCAQGSQLGVWAYADADKRDWTATGRFSCPGLSGNPDVSFSFDAELYGTAAYNYEISSSGITASASTCGASISSSNTVVGANGFVKPECLLQPLTIPDISVPISLISFTLTFKLALAAAVTGSMPGSMRFGSGASVTASLGGGISLANLGATPVYSSHSTFTETHSSIPFTLSGFNTFSGAAELVVIPSVTIALYGATGPSVLAAPEVRLQAAIGASSVIPGPTGVSTSGSAACAAGQGPYILAGSAGLTGTLPGKSFFDMLRAIPGVGGFVSWLPSNGFDRILWGQRVLFQTALTCVLLHGGRLRTAILTDLILTPPPSTHTRTLPFSPVTTMTSGCMPSVPAGSRSAVNAQGTTSLPDAPSAKSGPALPLPLWALGAIGGGVAFIGLLIILKCVCGRQKASTAGAPALQQHPGTNVIVTSSPLFSGPGAMVAFAPPTAATHHWQAHPPFAPPQSPYAQPHLPYAQPHLPYAQLHGAHSPFAQPPWQGAPPTLHGQQPPAAPPPSPAALQPSPAALPPPPETVWKQVSDESDTWCAFSVPFRPPPSPLFLTPPLPFPPFGADTNVATGETCWTLPPGGVVVNHI
jgi:hypothetical protein